MDNSKKMSLTVKMGLGFGVPLLMIAVIVTAISIVVNAVQVNAKLARDESVVFAGVARQMKLDVVQVQQWLTDISATRAKDGLDDGFDEAEKSYQSFMAGLAKFKKMYERENDSVGLRKVDELENAIAAYYEVGKKMANAYIEGGPEAGNKAMGEFDGTASRLAGNMDPFVESQVKRRFGKSDHLFHHVVNGPDRRVETKVPVRSTAQKVIPLDDDSDNDFKEFNS